MPRPLHIGQRAIRTDDGWERGDPVELDADALVRHAFVCGASGGGKTVFCKGLVEEAVLAGVPVIAVDFKGDLASLALRGPLATADGLRPIFGQDADAIAAEFAAGAQSTRLDAQRAAAYAERSHVRVFTPNSSLGRRVALQALPSFPEPVRTPLEREERDELIQALVLGFAHAMYGTSAAVKKNEPAVKLVEELVRWCADRGEPLEGAAGIARILQLVTEPPFGDMGGMSIDQYLPVRDKQRLMQKLNSRLLGAERSRYEGPRLSVETLLGDVPPGKTPLSVVYLGHSSDFAEQSAVLGQLCADIYRWMRKVGGSSGARLLVYVDELGGGDAKQAFYPSAPHNPPSKAPLNLLVRQGRSAGIAMLLATQNPVSVDVRGLGNINTWALGRLTRKNDHARVEDLLSRLPGGMDEGTRAVSQIPQGMVLAISDALDGPQYVYGRWLYSVHRQLSPGAVGVIHSLLEPDLQEPTPTPVSAARPVELPTTPEPRTRVDTPVVNEGPEAAVHTSEEVEEPSREVHSIDDIEEASVEVELEPLEDIEEPSHEVRSIRIVEEPSAKPAESTVTRARPVEEPVSKRRRPGSSPGPVEPRRGRRKATVPPSPEPTSPATRRFSNPQPVVPVETTSPPAPQAAVPATLEPPEAPSSPESAAPIEVPSAKGRKRASRAKQTEPPGVLVASEPKRKRTRKKKEEVEPETQLQPTMRQTQLLPTPEEDEHTDEGPTWAIRKRGLEDEDTDQQRTAARLADQSTRIEHIDDPGHPELTEVDHTSEVATQLHPTRKGRRKPQPPPDPEDNTDALLADALVPEPTRKPRKVLPEPMETFDLLEDDEDESSTLTFQIPVQDEAVPQEGRWSVKAGPQEWWVGPRGLTIGRSPRADAQIVDKHISRMHVQLQSVGSTLIVRRLNAKNPTWLDGRELGEPVRLEPRAQAVSLKLGDTEVRLSWVK